MSGISAIGSGEKDLTTTDQMTLYVVFLTCVSGGNSSSVITGVLMCSMISFSSLPGVSVMVVVTTLL